MNGVRQQQPNILLIMVDQLTAALTGAYGHPVVQTPNLNRLVVQGVRFDSAYSLVSSGFRHFVRKVGWCYNRETTAKPKESPNDNRHSQRANHPYQESQLSV